MQGFNDFDILDVETNESVRSDKRRRWPERTWDEIEIGASGEDWDRACYNCGLVCDSTEALAAHEEACA